MIEIWVLEQAPKLLSGSSWWEERESYDRGVRESIGGGARMGGEVH